jgi:WD40 repeat protein/tRNA A-37 threonylcarbamoyl transferase component Bud32
MAIDAARAKSLFLAASVMSDPTERAAYLDRECGGDAELRARVEALLRADALSGDPTRAHEPDRPVPTESYVAAEPEPGVVIAGRYTLVERIGEGGMGEVWVAKQTEPVKRRVALKLIKAGMDSKAVLQRFAQERQALALMDHPNIAKVLDGGITADRRPFFVMELVSGLPLARFCDDAKLGVRGRLELFVPICQAVQHAHQKGIIHRDLKPSNILVTVIDGRGVPKVIDFGVAKATSGRLTEESLSTQFGAVVGTLEYMSPEQAGFAGEDIDTRADIYSLGVILYEILTGLRPIDGQRLRKVAMAEMIRIIKEEEPSKPSTRLSTADSAPSLAALRQTEPKRLTALLRGELDWVVMKCLEKQRDRRYETASGLARDLQRYLADEMVEARPPSAGYRLRKFARRHRAALASVTAIAVLLVAGLSVSLWQMFRAIDAEGRAAAGEREARAQAGRADREAEAARINEQRARDEKLLSDRRWYASELNLAQQAWLRGQIPMVQQKLRGQQPPQPDTRDLRGFEWRLLDRLCQLELRRLHGHQGAVASVACSPDGRWIASAGNDGEIKIWDIASGQEGRTLQGHKEAVRTVTFSRDGGRLASVSSDRTVRVWNVTTGETLHAFPTGPLRSAGGVSFSPDGRYLAASGEGNTVKVWDLSNQQERFTLQGHTVSVESVTFSPDGRRLASGGGDQTIQLWDASTGKRILLLEGNQGPLFAVVFSPDGRRLASAGWNPTVRVWDADTGREVMTLAGHDATVRAVSFSPDGRRLASASDDRSVKLWDLRTGAETITLRGHGAAVGAVVFDRDGWRLITGSADQTVRIWETMSEQDCLTLRGHTNAVWSVTFSPDGRRLASSSEDRTIRLWDVATGLELQTLRGHRRGVYHAAFSPDGRLLASASRAAVVDGRRFPGVIKIWDAVTGQEIRTLAGHPGSVAYLAFSPGGQLAAAEADGTITLWDPATGKLLNTLRGHTRPVSCVAFSSDGRLLASSGGPLEGESTSPGDVRLWDVSGAREIARLASAATFVRRLAFRPDAKFLAGGGADHAVHIWDVNTGQEKYVLRGHTKPVADVAFSPDGRRLVSAGQDHTFKIWDPETTQELMTFPEHAVAVLSVAFSPDGQRLASAGYDHVIKLWNAEPFTPEAIERREAMSLVQFLATQTLSEEEVLTRLESDNTITGAVRQHARNLARIYLQNVIRGEAYKLVDSLIGTDWPRQDILEKVRTDRNIHEPLRSAVISLVQGLPEEPEYFHWRSRIAASRTDDTEADYQLAARQAEAACRGDPASSAYRTTLGLAQYRLGKFQKERYQAALATLTGCDQNDPTTLMFLAMVHWQLGEKDKARAWFDKAIQGMEQGKQDDTDLKRFRAEAGELLRVEKE